MVTKSGLFCKRAGPASRFHIPRPAKNGGFEDFTWEAKEHEDWWELADSDDLNNFGMSPYVPCPALGKDLRIVLCE
jgi:hypothetical protein